MFSWWKIQNAQVQVLFGRADKEINGACKEVFRGGRAGVRHVYPDREQGNDVCKAALPSIANSLPYTAVSLILKTWMIYLRTDKEVTF